MVSISGVEIKFGRIFLVVGIVVGLIVLYQRYGTGEGGSQGKEEDSSQTHSSSNTNDVKERENASKDVKVMTSRNFLSFMFLLHNC